MKLTSGYLAAIIPHRDLMRTEIYNDFLRPSGHYYGINLFALDGRDSTGDIRIWRRNGHPDFDRDELDLLSLTAHDQGMIAATRSIDARVSGHRASLMPGRKIAKTTPCKVGIGSHAIRKRKI